MFTTNNLKCFFYWNCFLESCLSAKLDLIKKNGLNKI